MEHLLEKLALASVPVLSTVILVIAGALIRMARAIDVVKTEVREVRHDVNTLDKRLYDMLRNGKSPDST